MLEQDLGKTSCIFQDLIAFQLGVDRLCSFWLEIDVLISDVTTVFKANNIFISFMSCLVVDRDVFIHTDRYKWRINHSILVNTVTVFLFSFEQLEGCPRKWCQMNRYCHAHLTSDASLTELVFWQIVLKISSQIFDFRFYSMPFQVFDTVTWQGQGCHLLIAFCWVQFFEITSRHINHCADRINLVM
ncbi:hypothetical protein SORDD21_00861 [Streptococcus oralis]|uniref:Uncharacterized protein n=1 Tax=Streptococcus oralis TaxID=1303 RepID=A0A139PMI2_STROR|nr:hypothetical protein SORDD21_00861 [Streptococcus oralis]